jgi:hypothetical protein
MSARRWKQHTEEVLDYDIDLAAWLGADTISGASVEVTPSGLTVTTEFTSTVAKVWVSGGAVNSTYHVTSTVTTAAGRTKETCFQIIITDCCDS